MGEDQIEGRERVAGDGNGDSQGGGEDRQGTDAVKFSRKRSYDPKNDNEPTFEDVEGGVKVILMILNRIKVMTIVMTMKLQRGQGVRAC